jgi:riboflavin kinase/FMN adenylyltransferase
VVRGAQLGSKLGTPTANIEVGEEQLPPDGVYAVEALRGNARMAGVANLGVRPTVEGRQRLLEVHLIDFSGDLYGEDVEVQFGRRLRGEETFADLKALKAQIGRDVAEARRLFALGVAMAV